MEGRFAWANTTVLHPVGFCAVILLGISLVLLPRRFAVFPMIILACFIPSAQRLLIAGADFNLLRILVLFGWVRLVLRNEFKGFVWNRLDTAVLLWMLSGTIVYYLQYGTTSALINRCGWMFDGLGMYFLFRCILRDWEDFDRMGLCFIIVSIPVAVAFLIEWSTGHNAFSVFGGVPQLTQVRGGRMRCQGAFSHPILAGCFWVSVIAYMLTQYRERKKWIVACGVAASLGIVFTCASSTPIMSLIFLIIAMCLFVMRTHLRLFRWGFVFGLFLLSIVMNKPIWHLFARANVFGSSTGWHRYRIMDATINNFHEWWLLGERDPTSWGVFEMRDITNQYILEAIRGGLAALVFFVAAIVVAFGMVGRALSQVEDSPHQRLFVWCFGASLFVHVWTFFAVSYFGQIIMLIYLNFALIGNLPNLCARKRGFDVISKDEDAFEGQSRKLVSG